MVTPRSIGGRANRRRVRLGFGDGTIENPLNLCEKIEKMYVMKQKKMFINILSL